MNFILHDIDQRTPEWHALRVGLLTGSCADAILAQRKRGTGELAKRAELRRRLVCERLTGLGGEDSFTTSHVERGEALEPTAFAAYEVETGQIVHRIGFVSHRDLKAGCSPDGYVGNWEGLIELKCPKQTTHLEYLQGGVLPEDYKGQVVHALWLTGAQWLDFCSFDDRFPESLELFRVRVVRNEAEIAAYELLVRQFLAEVDAEVEALRARAVVAA